jgi:hypothetical protein
MKLVHSLVGAVLASTCTLSSALLADDDNPHVWSPATKSVAVFKNGLAFVMRDAEVTLRDGWCSAQDIPPATFGTLAVYSHDSAHAVDIVGAGPGERIVFDGDDAPDTLDARRARLEASQKLKVELVHKYHGDIRRSAGEVVEIGDAYVILDDGMQRFAVPLADITELQMLDMPLRVHVANADLGGSAEGTVRLGMAYLRHGMTWIPEYTLRILDDSTAELTLRGTLINEAEDLVHADVNFVVGVPHFVHTDYKAPISVSEMIRTIGAAVASPELSQQIAARAGIATYMNTHSGVSVSAFDAPMDMNDGAVQLDATVGSLPTMNSAASSDYTVYTRRDMTLRRGEKAIVTLFRKTIAYGHRYRWESPELIRHYLVLKNDTGSAWTTGPALALSADQPLGEDLLGYTPTGGECEYRVTSAVNIVHDLSEREIARALKVHQPAHNRWVDLVTLEGTAKIRNFESTPIDVVVEIPVPGKPVLASEKGELRADATRLELTSRAGVITWTLTIPPGETKTLLYQYERYVPSG